LLGIAAGRPPTNERALQYLLSNIHSHYINFDPSGFSGVPFLPGTTPSGQAVLAKPGEVGLNAEFVLIQTDLYEPRFCHSQLHGRGSIHCVRRKRCQTPHRYRSSARVARAGVIVCTIFRCG